MSISLTPEVAWHVGEAWQWHWPAFGDQEKWMHGICVSGRLYADEVREDDRVFQPQGVKIVVDCHSLGQLNGTRVDFVRANILNQGFEFRNPNVKATCGRSESFGV